MIVIEVINHKEQRYPTLGDWEFSQPVVGRENLLIRVSDTGVSEFNQLIAIHELIEALLCKVNGVTQQEVDEWDMSHLELPEPGDHIQAPYHMEHYFASIIEHMVATEMGVVWEDYEQAVENTMAL